MPPRALARLVFCVLLLSSQLWPGVAMPAHAADAAGVGHANHAMPCHGTDANRDAPAPACKDRCCPHMTCDAGTCATLACLPAIADVLPAPAPAAATTAWNRAPAPPRVLETPLRPPIA